MPENAASTDWSLHPQLERDTVPIGDLPLCRVLLIKDANYPWILLVPRRAGVGEIIDLAEADRMTLIDEISRASLAMKSATGCVKINVAALGNVVQQLHVHVVARGPGDPAWPKPVWGAVPALPYGKTALQSRLADLRARLAISPV